MNNKGKEILIIKIEIGDGRYGDIVVHEYDEPEDLATEFCTRHRLDPAICESLVQTIDHNIDQLILESQAPATESSVSTVPPEKPPAPTHQRRASELTFTNMQKQPSNKSPYYEALKEDRFKTLFKLFNPNPEGFISYSTLTLSTFPSKLCEVLEPVIEELEESKEAIDFEEFSRALDALIGYLSPAESNLILAPRSSNNYPNRKNQTMRSCTPTYERLLDRNFQREEKLKQERQKKLADELKECTFQPNMHRRKPKVNKNYLPI